MNIYVNVLNVWQKYSTLTFRIFGKIDNSSYTKAGLAYLPILSLFSVVKEF